MSTGNESEKTKFSCQNFYSGFRRLCGAIEHVTDSFKDVVSKIAGELPKSPGPQLVDDVRQGLEFRLDMLAGDLVEKSVRDMRGGSATAIDEFHTSFL